MAKENPSGNNNNNNKSRFWKDVFFSIKYHLAKIIVALIKKVGESLGKEESIPHIKLRKLFDDNLKKKLNFKSL